METWATVVLVVGTNLVTALLALLGTKKQLKHSDKRNEKQLEAQREADEHNRKWEVRSQPLLAMREEIASMTEKVEKIVGYSIQIPVVDNLPKKSDEHFESLGKALNDWDAYIESGALYRVIHMQYEIKLKAEAHRILLDYHGAYMGVREFWMGKSTEKEIDGAKETLKKNTKRVSELQLRINEMLEEL